MPAWEDLVAVGAIVGAHGNRGEVAVHPLTSFPHRFARTHVVYAPPVAGEPVRLEVEHERAQGSRRILKFRGVDSIEAAERLSHQEIRVEVGDLEALPPHAYFLHDLVGCRVMDATGALIGTVARVLETGAAALLEVTAAPVALAELSRRTSSAGAAPGLGETRPGEGRGAEPILIPLAQEICIRVDTQAREIVVRAPAGLLDLN